LTNDQQWLTIKAARDTDELKIKQSLHTDAVNVGSSTFLHRVAGAAASVRDPSVFILYFCVSQAGCSTIHQVCGGPDE